MASTLLRTSALRGSALRRLSSHSGSSGVEPPSPGLDEKVNLLRRSIEELNSKVDRRYLISASLQKQVLTRIA
ncbi:unnamed protein product [Urochloa humidicola]